MASQTQKAAGLILAGGRSSRFGADKAAAHLGGASLLDHAIARLRPFCRPIAVSAVEGSAAAGLAAASGLAVLADVPAPTRGPLAGVASGLLWARAAGVDRMAVVPCDLPLLPADLVPRLLGSLTPADGAAAARTADGLQSLCIVVRVGVVDALVASLAQGRHPPVHAWLEQIGVREVDFDDAHAFLNVNTPEDLRRAELADPDA